MLALIIQHRRLSLSLLLAVCSLLACAEPKPPNEKFDGRCQLRIGQSPEVRGLRLGMTVEEVRRRFPALPIPAPSKVGSIYIRLSKLDPAEEDFGLNLEGVNELSLSFLDGRVSDVRVMYEATREPLTEQEFSSRLSEALNLPHFLSELECYDFRLTADARLTARGVGPELRIEDVAARKLHDERMRPILEETARRAERQRYEEERRKSEERKGALKP